MLSTQLLPGQRQVNYGRVASPQSSLNRGLLLWYKHLPQMPQPVVVYPGLSVRNLVNGRNWLCDDSAALVSAAGNFGRHGGHGSWYCNGGSLVSDAYSSLITSLDAVTQASMSFWGRVATSGNNLGCQTSQSFIMRSAGGATYFYATASDYYYINWTLPVNEWIHYGVDIDCSRSNTDKIRGYFNGVPQSLTVGVEPTSLNAGASYFFLGYAGGPSTGWLDDVRVWNRSMGSHDAWWRLYNESRQGVSGDQRQTNYSTKRYFLPFSPPTYTEIAFDSTSSSGYQTGSTYSWSHTCQGGNRALFVGISMLSVAGSSVTGITYNGVGLSVSSLVSSVSGACHVEIWELVAPASGTNTIEVTLSTSVSSAAGAYSFTGVSQVDPSRSGDNETATNVGAADATATDSVNNNPVYANKWQIDCVATDDTSITVGTGQSARWNTTGAIGSGGGSTKGPVADGTSSVTMYWTDVGALATWAIVSMMVVPFSVDTPTGRATKNTRSHPLGIRSGIGMRIGGRH